MVGSSKILTVSYGTFSCTLEGFDDSFDTMKAIAEYFRDLAADDRYFGAEPPTPDAEMLARIAEREIARRVEAREHEGRIVLRAQDNAQAGKALASALSTQPRAEAPSAPEPAPKTEPEAKAETAYVPETQEAREESPIYDTPEPEGLEREEAAPAAETPQNSRMPEPEAEAEPEPEAEPEVEAEVEAEAEEVPQPVAEANNLSVKLDLIRSVVGASETYDEDEHAEDFAEGDWASSIAWDEEDEDEPEAAEAADTEHEVEEHEAPESEDAEAEEDEIAEVEIAKVEYTETEIIEVEAQASDSEMPSRDEEDSHLEDTLAALLADATPLEAYTDEDDFEAETEETDQAAWQDTDDAHIARVIKVSRADVEAARAAGEFDDEEKTDDDVVSILDDETEALSPEDEAELQRELASLDAELDEEIALEDDEITLEDEEAALDDAAEDEYAPEAFAERPAPEAETAAKPDDSNPAEVSRIFEETDNHLADPGSMRRRNTIQHLRAALAATRAEKDAGSDIKKKIDASPYHGDLDAVVRPRRAVPAPDAPRSVRPEVTRPAPLKLVDEQRIDKPRTPVRPRRVTTPPVADLIEAQDNGFSAFAEELGATDLPDLLEAAAAYLADVEGRSQFSRPMLMGKLREIGENDFSREDGLRSFGQLLREGKLQKLTGGRFSVTEETEYRTAARRRAG